MWVETAEESLADMLPELDALITDYWYASPENAGHQELDFDWEQFCTLEKLGMCKVYVAHDEHGKMVGAAIYVVIASLHHRGYKMAMCDTLCTSISHRGKGIATKLVKYAEEQLKLLHVREIHHSARLVYNTKHLFPSLGFTAIETLYSKKVT